MPIVRYRDLGVPQGSVGGNIVSRARKTTFLEEIMKDSPSLVLLMDEITGDMLDYIGPNDGAVTIGASGVRGAASLFGGDFFTGYSMEYDALTSLVSISVDDVVNDMWDGPGATLEMVFNADSDGEGSAGRLVDKRSAGGWQIWLADESVGNMRIQTLFDFSGDNGNWKTAVDIPINTDTHFAIKYDADLVTNNPTIYLNNNVLTVGDGLTEDSTPTGTRTTDATSPFRIGNNSTGVNTFDGHIGFVAVYPSLLSDARMTAHYNRFNTGPQ